MTNGLESKQSEGCFWRMKVERRLDRGVEWCFVEGIGLAGWGLTALHTHSESGSRRDTVYGQLKSSLLMMIDQIRRPSRAISCSFFLPGWTENN